MYTDFTDWGELYKLEKALNLLNLSRLNYYGCCDCFFKEIQVGNSIDCRKWHGWTEKTT